MPEAFEKPIAAGVPAVGDADDEVGLDRRLVREPLAHADARAVHLDPAEPRVGPREVDVLEDAERVPTRGNRLRRVKPSSSTQTTSPGRTSRTTSAPMRSSAQVSDATTQSSPSWPSVEGAEPNGSRNATSVSVHERRDRVRALEPAHRVPRPPRRAAPDRAR